MLRRHDDRHIPVHDEDPDVDYEPDGHFVEVFRDGVDFDIECGRCGHTARNVAGSEEGARRVADAHEKECDGEDN